MNFNNANAVNFSYLLLEFYKKLEIDESELAVILMIDHLLAQGNSFFNSKNISMNMNLSENEIDLIMTNLYKRKMVEFNIENSKTVISLRPLKKLLYKKFQESIFTEEEIQQNKDLDSLRTEVYGELEIVMARELSPLEITRVDEWISSGTSKEIIMEAINDAKYKKINSIKEIDRIISRKLREEDLYGNAAER